MKRFALAALAATLSTQAFAGGYGAAGCGLGSVIFGSDSKQLLQILASTTNTATYSQTFGISFGTSNCGGGGAAPTVKAFIEANREALSNDISRGKGETLTNLTQLMGCTKTDEVGPVLQKNFKKIFPTAKVSPTEIETTIKSTLTETKVGNCS